MKCEKRTIKSDVETAQCKDGTVKCEKKRKKELPNVILELHNVGMKPSNVRKK